MEYDATQMVNNLISEEQIIKLITDIKKENLNFQK